MPYSVDRSFSPQHTCLDPDSPFTTIWTVVPLPSQLKEYLNKIQYLINIYVKNVQRGDDLRAVTTFACHIIYYDPDNPFITIWTVVPLPPRGCIPRGREAPSLLLNTASSPKSVVREARNLLRRPIRPLSKDTSPVSPFICIWTVVPPPTSEQ